MRLVIVDADSQQLVVWQDGEEVWRCLVSTGRAGMGCEENSGKTPLGWHRIAQVIGDGAAQGTRFVSREPTGEVWTKGPVEGDWITTRIFWLEGLEPGVNKGPGVDTYDRYIYLHGTAREDELGRPGSHGCVRMSNLDAVRLAQIVQAGDPVWIGSQERGMKSWHFAGIGGSGMSAIALYLLGRMERVSGSDRLFDGGGGASIRAALLAAGARLVPQDGSGLEATTTLVVSTAIEDGTPEIVRAKQLGCRIVHRSEALAEIAARTRCIAVSGTSGKSTVTAMVFRILRGAGLDPSVISGGVLRELSSQGHWGNAWGGAGEWLVIEADESDGSLVRYHPEIGMMLNLDRDHKELSELREIFATFRAQSEKFVVHGDRSDCLEIAGSDSFRFGLHNSSLPLPQNLRLLPDAVEFDLGEVHVCVPGPGMHMVENALAALAVGVLAGVDLAVGAKALEGFQGVGRRHEFIGEARGVRVFDDFAHNPAKIEAGISAAQLVAGEGRVLAVFQPHGYGPLRFLLEDFAASFAKALRPQDKLWISPVYDAGGTADRSISSKQLGDQIVLRGHAVSCPATREAIPVEIATLALPGDVVYSMGARDPELPVFAKAILSALETPSS